jgi:hypothetical protein
MFQNYWDLSSENLLVVPVEISVRDETEHPGLPVG